MLGLFLLSSLHLLLLLRILLLACKYSYDGIMAQHNQDLTQSMMKSDLLLPINDQLVIQDLSWAFLTYEASFFGQNNHITIDNSFMQLVLNQPSSKQYLYYYGKLQVILFLREDTVLLLTCKILLIPINHYHQQFHFVFFRIS